MSNEPVLIEKTAKQWAPWQLVGFGFGMALLIVVAFAAGAKWSASGRQPKADPQMRHGVIIRIGSGKAGNATLGVTELTERNVDGFYRVEGTVKNLSATRTDVLGAVVDLFGDDGTLIQSNRGFLALDTLPAGESCPFHVDVVPDPKIARYVVRFRAFPGDPPPNDVKDIDPADLRGQP